MASSQMLTVAVLLWTLGATVYTWELWKARGLTDNGFLGLLALMVGSLTMAYALEAHPTLSVCTMLPGLLAALIMLHKAWGRFMNLLRRQARERAERAARTDERPEFWTPGTPGHGPRPISGPSAPQMPDLSAEEERSRRLGKMFG